ncbi:MAG: hypothetical protein ACE15E_15170 [Acidobacteriota bacterium]
MVTTLFGEGQSYRRLSWSKPTLLGSLSLWEGSDHFVQIEVLAFSETHRRFYFEDIKAFTIRRTSRGLWLHLLFGSFTIVTAAITLWLFLAGYASGGALAWLAIGVPSGFALGWMIHLALGPTCACHVVTPVQNTRLGALGRIRSARKTVSYLARRAQTAQGGTVGEETSALSVESAPVIVPALPGAGQPDALTRESGYDGIPAEGLPRLYPIVSFASLLNAAFLFSLLLWDSYPLRAIQVLFVVGLLALGITCAANSRRKRGNEEAFWFKWIGWALFSVNGLVFLLWYGYGFYLAGLTRTGAPELQLDYAQQMLRISPHGSRFWFWVVLVDACFSMSMGLAGLLAVWQRARPGKDYGHSVN